jgi:hypothetical protein
MLICSYLLWKLYQELQLRGLAHAGRYLLTVLLVVWGFEAMCHMVQVKRPIYHLNQYLPKKKENYTPIIQASGKSAEDFQAILQLPLVAVGNETMGVSRGFWTLREGIHASFETGLPLIDYSLSRTSVAQGLDLVELISSPYAPKRRARRFNDKPILLLCEEEFMIPEERIWIEKGTLLGTYKSITLYSVPVAAFKEVIVPSVEQLSVSRECSGWFIDFENYPCDTVMAGRGAMPVRAVPTMIWSYTDTASTERMWLVSFWNYIDRYRSVVAVPRLKETTPEGIVIRDEGIHRENLPFSEAFGDWLEIHFPMRTLGAGYHYEIHIDNAGPVIDNLLIRPAQDTCLYTFSQMMLFDNRPVPALK